MILPIYAYGQPVLKKKARLLEKNYPDLDVLIENMFETMYNAKGVGLAAPQIGRSIRLFIVDTAQIEREDTPDHIGIKQAFINAEILEESGKHWEYEEGCLSIPHIHGDVSRQPVIKIRYLDENFETHEKDFKGTNARVIQHEFDHIEGILFVEHLKPIRRRLINRKLESIKKGKVDTDYTLRFVKKR